MNVPLYKTLAATDHSGYVIAPPGFGKTHLIALAVNETPEKSLILTHTYAGVDSIQKKLNKLKVPRSKYGLDTIAGWSLMLCRSYPLLSNWVENQGTIEISWNEVYDAINTLVDKRFMHAVIRSSYSKIYVDEYQDCSQEQHSLFLKLSSIIPCCFLGDPLQSIFDFNGQKSVDWETQIIPHFSCLGTLDTPWRWQNAGTALLGRWLEEIRLKIENHERISLTENIPPQVTIESSGNTPSEKIKKQCYACFQKLRVPGSVVGIFGGNPQGKNSSHSLAKRLSGKYSSIEEIESKVLCDYVRKLENNTTPNARVIATIELMEKCCTRIKKALCATVIKGELTQIREKTKNPQVAEVVNKYLVSTKLQDLFGAILTIVKIPEVKITRRDLFYRLKGFFEMFFSQKEQSLSATLKKYQTVFRRKGRFLKQNKILATPLLIKGLEYDHAILLDPDSMKSKELYVALTRATESITIITSKKFLKFDASE